MILIPLSILAAVRYPSKVFSSCSCCFAAASSNPDSVLPCDQAGEEASKRVPAMNSDLMCVLLDWFIGFTRGRNRGLRCRDGYRRRVLQALDVLGIIRDADLIIGIHQRRGQQEI